MPHLYKESYLIIGGYQYYSKLIGGYQISWFKISESYLKPPMSFSWAITHSNKPMETIVYQSKLLIGSNRPLWSSDGQRFCCRTSLVPIVSIVYRYVEQWAILQLYSYVYSQLLNENTMEYNDSAMYSIMLAPLIRTRETVAWLGTDNGTKQRFLAHKIWFHLATCWCLLYMCLLGKGGMGWRWTIVVDWKIPSFSTKHQ